MSAGGPLLSIKELHAHYGKSHILHGVTFDVAPSEVVSLLGRNGSGRSTTLKAIMGLVKPSHGRVRLRDRELAGARPYAVCRAGIAYVPEEREVFANLTVDENLRMGEQPAVLGATRWTVEQIAVAAGYEDPGAFRKVFQKITGLSPGDYRSRFGLNGRV